MHVAMLSWRDLGNPEAGGAERYLTHVAEGLAERGHRVTLLTAAYPGAPAAERVGEVVVRRAGGKLTVYPRASMALVRRLRDVDVVVDVQNGVPFFSRLATRAPVVVLVHHVHREQWPVVYGPVAAGLGWWVESTLAPRLYRTSRYVTVSEHTRRELTDLGVHDERITVIHNGTDEPRVNRSVASQPRIISLGRLVPHKQVEHALRLVARLTPIIPGLHLDIVGDGWWRGELHSLAHELDLSDAVTFHGYVSEHEKEVLLARSWVNLVPSLKEGWGLSVVEAGAHGVPTVGYRDAGGLTDSIVDGRTGMLVSDEDALVAAVRRLLTEDDLRIRMGDAARRHALSFTWEATVNAFEKVLADAVATAGGRQQATS